ncbi:MAG: lipoprotein [Steroidobacterales bacterium]
MKTAPASGLASAPTARLWIAGIGALLACAGCGFKGPLYLPEHNATIVTRAGQAGQAGQPAPSANQTQSPAAKSKSKNSSSPPPASAPRSPPPQSVP